MSVIAALGELMSLGAAVGAWVTAFSFSGSGNEAGWGGYTMRQRFDSSVLVPGSKVRLTFSAINASGVTVQNATLGVAATSGDSYDFSSPPIALSFSGSPGFTLSAAGSIVSDPVTITLASGRSLICAMYFGSPSVVAIIGASSAFTSYYKLGNDVSTTDASGYTPSGSPAYIISRVEVFQP